MLYMLIDVTTVEGTSVLKVAPMKEIQAWGKIFTAQGKKVIAPPLEGRGFAKLEPLQLQYLFWNTCAQTPPSEYELLVEGCKYWVELVAVDKTPLVDLEREVTKLAPVTPEPARTETGRQPAERKPRATSSTPSERPKGTSTTGRVWEIADNVLGGTGASSVQDWKPIRAEIMKRCEAEGINPATAATQYSKWKASKLSKGGA